MTEKVKLFLEDIQAVCRKHGLVLTVTQYDGFQVWPIDERSMELLMDPEDRTGAA